MSKELLSYKEALGSVGASSDELARLERLHELMLRAQENALNRIDPYKKERNFGLVTLWISSILMIFIHIFWVGWILGMAIFISATIIDIVGWRQLTKNWTNSIECFFSYLKLLMKKYKIPIE